MLITPLAAGEINITWDGKFTLKGCRSVRLLVDGAEPEINDVRCVGSKCL